MRSHFCVYNNKYFIFDNFMVQIKAKIRVLYLLTIYLFSEKIFTFSFKDQRCNSMVYKN